MKMNRTVILLLTATIILTQQNISQEQEKSTLEKIRQQQAVQKGQLFGKITDERSGEEIIGANVSVVGTKLGASTDIDGKFRIKNLPEGTYDIRISFLGYETKVISGVTIALGEELQLDASLNEDQGIQQQEVVISAATIKSGEGAILAERKKASGIGDGISSEQMKKAPDATSGDALKRITGVSIVDNKFIFVRGVTDRYNQTTLNGTSAPSTNADKKSFSFDMLPSNLLENMNVAKTALPDLPGDFTGGLVQLHTLDVPEQMSLKIVGSGSANSLTTYRKFNRTIGGKNDWTGFDDGSRANPNMNLSLPELASTLPNSWGTRASRAPMANSFSISYGDRIDLEEGEIGIITALTYRNNFQHTDYTKSDYGNRQVHRTLSGYSDRMSVLWGGIFDLTYKFADDHKISFKNNYNRAAEDKAFYNSGISQDNDDNFYSYQTEWEERGMYSGQISGESRFPDLFGATVEWTGYFSDARTNLPDNKSVEYALNRTYPDTDPFAAKPGIRSWGNIYEKNLGAKMHAVIPMNDAKLKFGFANETKQKSYEMLLFQINQNFLSGQNYSLVYLPVDSIYRRENFGPGKFGLNVFKEMSGAYQGDQKILALYGMADVPFMVMDLHFRVTGGIRLEKSNQNVVTEQGRYGSEGLRSVIDKTDILPSMNFTYLIDQEQNFRLAYSQTVNRPEFREMSEFYYQDYDKNEYVKGNSSLRRALIRNYDVRYEIFPSAGDLFAVSYFHKSFSHPIEEMLTYNAAVERTWINAEYGKNYGWEFEARKGFGFIDRYFSGLQLIVNYTRVFSTVPYREIGGSSMNPEIIEGTRPMQGQSPYTYNISLFFTEPNFGTSVNLLYNEYGSRIDAVGDVNAGDGNVYEQKRGTIDFSVSQPLSMIISGFESKFTVKNLNNQPIVFTQGNNLYRRNNIGVNYSLQFGFSF